jgi:hypothetical protein
MVAALAAVGTFVTANAALLQGIGTAVSAFGAISSARAQQKQYNAQAAQAKIQGRTQAIQYKQQGADVLRNINETLAMTTARAGQFGDPTLGSALSIAEICPKRRLWRVWNIYRQFGTCSCRGCCTSKYLSPGRTHCYGRGYVSSGWHSWRGHIPSNAIKTRSLCIR